MPRYRVLPYKQGSAGAKSLAIALGGKVLKLQGSKFVRKPSDIIINWGNVNASDTGILNPGALLQKCSNKLEFFRRMEVMNLEEIIPKWWTKQSDIPDDAFPIVCRTVLAGHSGDGIVIANTREELVQCPLYVQYVKKKHEFRIHVGRKLVGNSYEAQTISVQRKARNTNVPDDAINWQVRNHSNGFVYVRNNVTPPSGVVEAAQRAFMATDLDFLALDVLWNQHEGKAYVLEGNTAPGLEGQTVVDYARFFTGNP